MFGDGYDGVESFCGFAVAAEYDFGEAVQIVLAECAEDFFDVRFMVEPKRSGAVYTVGIVAQAEGAVAWAAVGYVEVKTVFDFVRDNHV